MLRDIALKHKASPGRTAPKTHRGPVCAEFATQDPSDTLKTAYRAEVCCGLRSGLMVIRSGRGASSSKEIVGRSKSPNSTEGSAETMSANKAHTFSSSFECWTLQNSRWRKRRATLQKAP